MAAAPSRAAADAANQAARDRIAAQRKDAAMRLISAAYWEAKSTQSREPFSAWLETLGSKVYDIMEIYG